MIAIMKEKGQWGKDAYTAKWFETKDDIRNESKRFQGIISISAIYGDDISEERALQMHYKEMRIE